MKTWTMGVLALALAACSRPGERGASATVGGSGLTAASDGGDTGRDDDSEGDDDDNDGDGDTGVFDVGNGDGTPMDGDSGEECNATTVEGDLTTRPIDVIMVVDTSTSMQEHTNAIEASINDDFAAIIEASGLDYQVIVLAAHGDGPELCVQQPLSGTDCNPPPAVAAETPQFHQYDAETGSEALLQNILDWYGQPDPSGSAPGGWSDWVRDDAQKIFLAFSDTQSTSNDPGVGTAWDDSLLAMAPGVFGAADDRRYIFHAIIGIAYKGMSGSADPWLPEDGLQLQGECGSDDQQGPGGSIQQVSVLTGGWRFPVCVPQAFDTVFQQVAQAIVEGAPVSCDIEIPPAPEGETIDPDTIEVEYNGGDGGTAVFTQVPTLADCGIDNFYIVGDTIHLCPGTCETVQVDEAAQLRVSYGCDVGYDPAG